MAKKYTAQDMREFADAIAGDLNGSGHTSVSYTFDDLIPVIESLRQAADALEREEKREKEYEYKVLYRRRDGRVCDSLSHAQNIQLARKTLGIYSGYKDAHIVRRPVGEWEEVK